MTEPEPAPLFGGLITLTASATVVHPDGADLSELPAATPADGDDETETS
jgi:hypothetical protein